MSIRKLLKTIDKTNLVPDIMRRKDGEHQLAVIGRKVCEQHDDNQQSMDEWTTLLEGGLDVAKPDAKSKSSPWDNASNYKSPIITEAARQFGDRTKMEVMTKDELATFRATGVKTPDKDERGKRIASHINYQLNFEIPYFRQEMQRKLYILAAQGALFKKTFYNPYEGVINSEWIQYPNFSVNQECDTIEDSDFTEIKYYYPNDIWERMNSSLWYEYEVLSDLKTDSNKDEQFEFLEQYTWIDIDGDGYEEPYIVTVHKTSGKVVRIAPRWDIGGIYVDYNGAYHNLQRLIEDLQSQTFNATPSEEFNQARYEQILEDIEKNSQLARIKPTEIITYYGFIEPIDGSFLGWGYCQLMVSAIKGVNKGSNSLFNSSDLSNLQGGYLSKEHRGAKKGDNSTKPGRWVQTTISARDLATSVLPHQFKEPSQTLLLLVEGLKTEAQEMATRFNMADALSPNIPAASVLGMLQEGIVPTSSLMKNVIDALSHELTIIYRLNQEYTDPLTYQRVVDGQVDFREDYSDRELDIKPTANAQFSSQMEKIQMAEAQLARVDLVVQVGGNPVPIVEYYYEALNSPIVDQIFPDEIPKKDQQRIEKMNQLQQQNLEQMQLQNQLLLGQVEIMKQDADRKDRESQAKIDEIYAGIENDFATLKLDAEKAKAEIILKYEQAEAENARTDAEIYQKQIELLDKVINNASSNR